MTPSEINIFLTAAKISKERLAKELRCSKADIVKTINGHQRNERIRELIADRFGMTVDEFFGKDHELAIHAKQSAA